MAKLPAFGSAARWRCSSRAPLVSFEVYLKAASTAMSIISGESPVSVVEPEHFARREGCRLAADAESTHLFERVMPSCKSSAEGLFFLADVSE